MGAGGKSLSKKLMKFMRHLMFFEELLEVVGAGSKHTAVSTELDIFHHHSDVAVLSFQTLLVQQLQEDALVFIVNVLHCLSHLHTKNSG